jgi:hypothetical protein
VTPRAAPYLLGNGGGNAGHLVAGTDGLPPSPDSDGKRTARENSASPSVDQVLVNRERIVLESRLLLFLPLLPEILERIG